MAQPLLRVENLHKKFGDLEVLKGAQRLLNTPTLQFVIVEFGFNPDDSRHVFLNRFLIQMASCGFSLGEISGLGMDGVDLYGNALFTRNSVSPKG